ncbi:cytosolic factor SEC14 [Trypanosoma theileri]|uniref:Cytosolic factor SEC14 n=1 Tax=Trypanosoma theileri TaxID=67003 RepID=A0A1X0P8J0_9TRYP|nr:cytosolic factor SEC14 [Trypanosoma theileri]ORC93151.1 cytosolic factor SEC14 [Trypanosoma theileri]
MTIVNLGKDSAKVGMRVQNIAGLTGTIRWVGTMEKKENPPDGSGFYAGVEYDEGTTTKNRIDGSWEGKRYFTCDPDKGELIKAKTLFPEMNTACIAAIRGRFGEQVANWEDFQLVKFCIARQFHMPDVFTMIQNHLEWLQEFKPSCDEYFPDSIIEDYPCGFSGAYDYDNNIIYCERPGNGGKCTPTEFMRRYGPELVTRWHACAMETGKKIMTESHFKHKRLCYIVDLTSVSVSMSRSLIKFGRTVATIDQANYPEQLARLIILRAPTLFRAIWKMMRVFIDENTLKKVIFVPEGKEIETMKKYMREEDIPDFAGGTSKAWRRNGGRIGSADSDKVFKGKTIISPELQNGQDESGELESDLILQDDVSDEISQNGSSTTNGGMEGKNSRSVSQ